MNWEEAVKRMRDGKQVIRRSEDKCEPHGTTAGGTPIVLRGKEPSMLAAAWSDDHGPVFVFQGAWSKMLFAPGDEEFSAADWAVSED